jgi:hypothetical protein
MQSKQPNLEQLQFGAKIDFITFPNHQRGRRPLPPLDGRIKWSRRKNYRRFSIHDPSPSDIAKLIHALGPDTPILEMEVSVDVAPARTPNVPLLEEVMVEMFGRRLCPSAPSLATSHRRAWRERLERLVMLGDSPPLPDDQFLIGKRTDPVQVKCYLKQTDQGSRLADKDAVARVEVRLSGEELSAVGLPSLVCLDGFPFRKQLTPYFRHCTPVQRGGKGRAPQKRSSDIAINDRIGQALHRLEQRHKGIGLPAGAPRDSRKVHHFHTIAGVGQATL